MRARVLVVALAAALVAAWLFRDAGGSGAADRPPAAPRATVPATVGAPPAPVPSAPPRNVFEYADARPAEPFPDAPPALPGTMDLEEAPGPAPEPSPVVRLIGLMRRAGEPRAALAVAGQTVVLSAGESAAGYTVLSIDEEEGVRVRAADGTVLFLPRAPQ